MIANTTAKMLMAKTTIATTLATASLWAVLSASSAAYGQGLGGYPSFGATSYYPVTTIADTQPVLSSNYGAGSGGCCGGGSAGGAYYAAPAQFVGGSPAPSYSAPFYGAPGYASTYPQSPGRDVYLGRGLLGQPKAYVSGQPLRNGLRFLTP